MKTSRKNKFSTNWYHTYKPIKSDLGLKDTDVYSVPVKCFFGENYLKDSDNIVGIVEAPKTAVILKEIYPQIDWVATAGEQTLFNKNLDVLIDKKVILFPDAHTIKWKEFANEKGFYCSDILERNDIEAGEDIADYIFNSDADVFSELHELLFALNLGEFDFDVEADSIKLDFDKSNDLELDDDNLGFVFSTDIPDSDEEENIEKSSSSEEESGDEKIDVNDI